MDIEISKKIVAHLAQFITPERLNLFDQILLNRTRYLTVILEDIFQPHNASAVLRTCDCFGVQDVHIIENENKYEVNPDVALGAYKWLDLIKHNSAESNTKEAFKTIRNQGYTIVATSPHKGDFLIDDFPIDKRPAFVFGTELKGLTTEALQHADAFVKIPMYGFTESFNISVSAAIILHHFTEKLRNSNLPWKLSDDEKIMIKLQWMRNTIKRSDLIEKEFLKFL